MTATRTFALATLALFGLLGITATPALAVDRPYTSGLIRNDLPVTMKYQYKVDNGNWVSMSLAPGQTHTLSMAAPANNNKVIHIRFDSVPTDGSKVTFQYTTLARYSCTHPSKGYLQRFLVVNSGKNIALMR